MDDMNKTLGTLFMLNMLGKDISDRDNALRTREGSYTIDSCWTADNGYETAIWKQNNPAIIVERYDTEIEMKYGHDKWVEFCKGNPKSVWSVQLDEEEEFEDNE